MMTNIFITVLGLSVSISLIVAVLIFLTPFLGKRYAAKWKYLIWIFLALRLLVPFSGSDVWSVTDMLPLKTQTAPQSEEKYTDTPSDITIPSRLVVEIPTQMTTPIAVQSEKNNISITMLDIAAFVWMAGSLIFISIHFISYLHYKRQVMKRGTVIKDARILCQMSMLKRELHIRCNILAIEYSEAGSPMIIGFLKPVLVLPKEQYSTEELFFILKHELVHLKRKDNYFKLLFVAANAFHWFNPLIWIMQKEAVIDMELSCDERVTQGTDYAVRKAYTETLLSTLHKQCTKRTVLSTQFYGGKKIMKKRFKNILMKKGKKNGISILICSVILTIGLGTLIGCQVTKEDTGDMFGQSGNEDISFQQIPNETLLVSAGLEDQMPVDTHSADDNILENTTVLTFFKEGEPEEKQAALVVGDGYSLYLPDDEWQRSDTDLWTAAVNEQVRLWVTYFENTTIDDTENELIDNGYVTEENHNLWIQEGNLIYKAELKESENGVWGIFYCYPTEAEEGWGRELPVIADTFAVTVYGLNHNRDLNVNEYLKAEDCQEIRNIVDEFAAAYFDGNADAVQKFLASTYEGNVDTYHISTGTISALNLKGLSDTDEKKIDENGKYVVSLEFKDNSYEDMLLYLTFEFIKQEDGWKIQFYGLEG